MFIAAFVKVSIHIKTHPRPVDLATVRERHTDMFPFLLGSARADDKLSRYSLLLGCPGETIKCDTPATTTDFLAALNEKCPAFRAPPAAHIPFRGGWFVYLGYELGYGIEPKIDAPGRRYRFPVAFATRCRAAIIVDHRLGETLCVAEGQARDMLPSLADAPRQPRQDEAMTFESITEEKPGIYLRGVAKALEYIRAGDVFQVNLSRRWQARLRDDDHGDDDDAIAAGIYRKLRRANPAPFACHIRHGDGDSKGDIISSSPERLVRAANGYIETRPIAGTRPRGDGERDRRWRDELQTDRKERAEHIMLIDLERNDLGRVCEPGTIEVDEFMRLESYQYVHHIVSNIRGRLRRDAAPVDVIRAMFPGGTITGAPKVRCMEIIAELERGGRGPYTGSVGYINNDGAMDMNILIRTLFKQGRDIVFRAGAGIVADSDPARELAETRHKARGMLAALTGRPPACGGT